MFPVFTLNGFGITGKVCDTIKFPKFLIDHNLLIECSIAAEVDTEELRNFMKKNYKPNFSYQDFARDFTAEFYDPIQWAKLFEESGAKYVVLTSKHHEGYTMWPSKYSFSWNSMDVGPHRDLVGKLNVFLINAFIKINLFGFLPLSPFKKIMVTIFEASISLI